MMMSGRHHEMVSDWKGGQVFESAGFMLMPSCENLRDAMGLTDRPRQC